MQKTWKQPLFPFPCQPRLTLPPPNLHSSSSSHSNANPKANLEMTSIGLVCLVSGRKAAFVLAIKSWLVARVSLLSLAQQHSMQGLGQIGATCKCLKQCRGRLQAISTNLFHSTENRAKFSKKLWCKLHRRQVRLEGWAGWNNTRFPLGQVT